MTSGAFRLAIAVLLAAAALPTHAQAAVTCQSGFPVQESPGIRFFIAYPSPDAQPGLYACTPHLRRPKLVFLNSPATTLSPGVERRFGNRIALDIEEFADGGNGVWIGWLDVKTGRYAEAEVGGPKKPEDPEADNESWSPRTSALAIGPTGAAAYAFAAFGKTYELFHRPYTAGKFGKERAVVTVPEADFDPATLRLTRAALVWRTRGREQNATAPLSPNPGRGHVARADPSLSCEAPGGIHLADRWRFFVAASTVFGCTERSKARPLKLAPRGATATGFEEDGATTAFVVRHGPTTSVSVVDARTERIRTRVLPASPYGGRPRVLSLASRSDGSVVLVQGDSKHRQVLFLSAHGAGFMAPVTLASLPATEIAPHTLRLTRGTASWRAVGDARSAPAG